MANIIQFKRSSVAGKVPTSEQLAVGELAMNLVDRKLYTKNASGSVLELAPFVLDTSGAVKKAGDTMTGKLTLSAGLAVTNNATFANNVSAAALSVSGWTTLGNTNLNGTVNAKGFVNCTGTATFSNPVTLVAPVDPLHAATKQYVDDSYATTYKSTGGRINGNISWNLEKKGVQWGNIIGNETGFTEGSAIYMASRYPESAPSGSNDYLIFQKTDQNGSSPDGGFIFNWRARNNNTAVTKGDILQLQPYRLTSHVVSQFNDIVQIGPGSLDAGAQLRVVANATVKKNWAAMFKNDSSESGKNGVYVSVGHNDSYAYAAFDAASSQRFGVTSRGVVSGTVFTSTSKSVTTSSTVTPNLAEAQVHRFITSRPLNIANPATTGTDTGVWYFYVIQGSTGYAVTFGTNYHIISGSISTQANAVNVCQVIADGTGHFDVIIHKR